MDIKTMDIVEAVDMVPQTTTEIPCRLCLGEQG
jgi:hypothetical protein